MPAASFASISSACPSTAPLSAKLAAISILSCEVTEMKRNRTIAVVVAMAFCLVLPMLALADGTLPSGSVVSVVIDQAVSSKTAKIGQRVTGTLSQDVASGGKVIIPKGSAARMSVSSVQSSGRLSTPANLWLRLRAVTIGGKSYKVATTAAGHTMGGKAKRDTVFIGGGAGLGALVGGLAGGGKGAVIGALAGGGAGTAGAAATGKKDVEIPAEARLEFRTQVDVTIQ
jgi:hypothetical protein